MNEKERLIKALNSYEYFENNKDKLIDLFVSYMVKKKELTLKLSLKMPFLLRIKLLKVI